MQRMVGSRAWFAYRNMYILVCALYGKLTVDLVSLFSQVNPVSG